MAVTVDDLGKAVDELKFEIEALKAEIIKLKREDKSFEERFAATNDMIDMIVHANNDNINHTVNRVDTMWMKLMPEVERKRWEHNAGYRAEPPSEDREGQSQ